MKVFEEAGIDCDLVVGSSVGSLIGAFWAAGYSTAQIAEVASSGGPLTLFDISPFADWGWIHGQRLQDYVNDQIGTPLLEKLKRRLIVVTTRRDKPPPSSCSEATPAWRCARPARFQTLFRRWASRAWSMRMPTSRCRLRFARREQRAHGL